MKVSHGVRREYEASVGGIEELCFFFNDTATTEIYTLSLHDALPIWLLSFTAPGR